MLRTKLNHLTVPLLLLFGISSANSQSSGNGLAGKTGTLEKMIVAGRRHDGSRFEPAEWNSRRKNRSWTHCVSKRAPILFSRSLFLTMFCAVPSRARWDLSGRNSAILPEPLNTSSNQLVIEKLPSSEPFDLVVRDGKTGFVFFNIEGIIYDYDAAAHLLSINGGRLLISEEFASKLGRPAEAGVERWRNFDRRDHVSDRNHDSRQRRGPIVDTAAARRRRLRMLRKVLCRDLMSSLEICPP